MPPPVKSLPVEGKPQSNVVTPSAPPQGISTITDSSYFHPYDTPPPPYEAAVHQGNLQNNVPRPVRYQEPLYYGGQPPQNFAGIRPHFKSHTNTNPHIQGGPVRVVRFPVVHQTRIVPMSTTVGSPCPICQVSLSFFFKVQ